MSAPLAPIAPQAPKPVSCRESFTSNLSNHKWELLGSGSVAGVAAAAAINGGLLTNPMGWTIAAAALSIMALLYFVFKLFATEENPQPLSPRSIAVVPNLPANPPPAARPESPPPADMPQAPVNLLPIDEAEELENPLLVDNVVEPEVPPSVDNAPAAPEHWLQEKFNVAKVKANELFQTVKAKARAAYEHPEDNLVAASCVGLAGIFLTTVVPALFSSSGTPLNTIPFTGTLNSTASVCLLKA